jgi:hypothetical protein
VDELAKVRGDHTAAERRLRDTQLKVDILTEQVSLLRASIAGSGVNQEMRKVVIALTDQLGDKTEMAETLAVCVYVCTSMYLYVRQVCMF